MELLQKDYSKQNLTSFPSIPNQTSIVRLNISDNFLTALPSMDNFKSLRFLDISSNNISDFSPLESMTTLRELDCSNNNLISLDFSSKLLNLEILKASNNKIHSIHTNLPMKLKSLDLSYNELSTLEFLQTYCPTEIEKIDVSHNLYDSILNLKYISVFQRLRILNVGFMNKNKELRLLSFVKHICPCIEVFDGYECKNLTADDEWDDSKLIEVLVRGDEGEFRKMLTFSNSVLRWDEPFFFDYIKDSPPSPLKEVNERLRHVELLANETKISEAPIQHDVELDEDFQNIRKEIQELKKITLQLSQIVYVHDRALQQLWESH